MAVGGLGAVVVVIVFMLLGRDPRPLLEQMGQQPAGAEAVQTPNPQQDELAKFVSVTLADTEDVWNQLFSDRGDQYREPKLVLFSDRVQSACGFQSAATGPFYCPPDETVYIDLAFYDELKRKLGAPGDFAQAYVIAHEVGHHVQKLLGISDQVQRQQMRASKAESNRLSVCLELQADFFAGVWANHAQRNWRILEPGDIEEALNAAAAIGDDRLQEQSRGHVVPESFTHGTSEQRVRWFVKGLKTGDMAQGDTFSAEKL